MNHEWFHRTSGMFGIVDEVGPIPETEILALAMEGKLKRDSLVRSPTRTNNAWFLLPQIAGLAKALEDGEKSRQAVKDAQAQKKAAARQEVAPPIQKASAQPVTQLVNYIYADANNKPVGPVTLEQLRELQGKGVITWHTLVMLEGTKDWKPYGKIVAELSPPLPPNQGVLHANRNSLATVSRSDKLSQETADAKNGEQATCPRCGRQILNHPNISGRDICCPSCNNILRMPALPAIEMERANRVVYVSGPLGLRAGSEGDLFLNDEFIIFSTQEIVSIFKGSEYREHINVPYLSITDISVDTAERLSALGLLLIGVFAFAFKVKDRFLKISITDEAGLRTNIIFGKVPFGPNMDEVARRIIYRRQQLLQLSKTTTANAQETTNAQGTSTPQNDIASTLERLASLRDKGILTEEEFQQKKTEILARF